MNSEKAAQDECTDDLFILGREGRAPRITVLSSAELTERRLNTSWLSTGDMCGSGFGVVCIVTLDHGASLVLHPASVAVLGMPFRYEVQPVQFGSSPASEQRHHAAHFRPCSTQATTQEGFGSCSSRAD